MQSSLFVGANDEMVNRLLLGALLQEVCIYAFQVDHSRNVGVDAHKRTHARTHATGKQWDVRH